MQVDSPHMVQIASRKDSYNENPRAHIRHNHHWEDTLDAIIQHLERDKNNRVQRSDILRESIHYPTVGILFKEFQACVDQFFGNVFVEQEGYTHEDFVGEEFPHEGGKEAGEDYDEEG